MYKHIFNTYFGYYDHLIRLLRSPKSYLFCVKFAGKFALYKAGKSRSRAEKFGQRSRKPEKTRKNPENESAIPKNEPVEKPEKSRKIPENEPSVPKIPKKRTGVLGEMRANRRDENFQNFLQKSMKFFPMSLCGFYKREVTPITVIVAYIRGFGLLSEVKKKSFFLFFFGSCFFSSRGRANPKLFLFFIQPFFSEKIEQQNN